VTTPAKSTRGTSLPRVRRPEVAMTLPTAVQVRALLAAAPDEWGAFVALCAFAGLRLGEVAALQVGDIDFLRRTLAVARQVQRADGGTVEIRPPKYDSERTVYLAGGLVEILSVHIAAHCPGTAPRRFVFGLGKDVPRIRTRSGTGGTRPVRRPGAARSSWTIWGISTPAALSRPGAMW
jgi:integrase